jgi:dienelactone hydrolase
MRRLVIPVAGIAILSAATVWAQSPRRAFPPPSPDVTVDSNVQFGTAGAVPLEMDLYQLPRAAGRTRPALIFFTRGSGSDRQWAFYVAWARSVASHDIVGIIPDLRNENQAHDFQSLVDYLTRHGTELGVDTAAIAVYAASGNVYTALPLLENPRQTAIKSAVIYYGAAPVTTFRRDLPVLYVRAGLDRPDVNREIGTLATRAVTQNAPVTLLNHATGYHGFEELNDDDATRDVIARTIEFVRHTTSAGYRAALSAGLREADAAASVETGDYRQATSIYAELVRSRPDDARLRLSYGEALLGDQQYAAACTLFDSLKGKGLGYRDLGVPASRACAQAGKPDAAVAWIASIPPQFRPSSLASDSAFVSLHGRSDFRALFPQH